MHRLFVISILLACLAAICLLASIMTKVTNTLDDPDTENNALIWAYVGSFIGLFAFVLQLFSTIAPSGE